MRRVAHYRLVKTNRHRRAGCIRLSLTPLAKRVRIGEVVCQYRTIPKLASLRESRAPVFGCQMCRWSCWWSGLRLSARSPHTYTRLPDICAQKRSFSTPGRPNLWPGREKCFSRNPAAPANIIRFSARKCGWNAAAMQGASRMAKVSVGRSICLLWPRSQHRNWA